MCGGIAFIYEENTIKAYFPNPRSQLPVLKRDGRVELIAWGRHKEQAGNLPLGGWARHDSIKAGKWQKYFPTPVKIAATEFMEKDIEGNSHWFELTEGQWIQGLLASYDKERRIYVVTITPEKEDSLFERWPRIVSCNVTY